MQEIERLLQATSFSERRSRAVLQHCRDFLAADKGSFAREEAHFPPHWWSRVAPTFRTAGGDVCLLPDSINCAIYTIAQFMQSLRIAILKDAQKSCS